MSFNVVQKHSDGRYYLYEATSVWDPNKKQSRQKRVYLGACDSEGNLLDTGKTTDTQQIVVKVSPVFGPYHLMLSIAEDIGLRNTLREVYGTRDGDRLLALAILGVVNPCSGRMIESEIEDTFLRELMGVGWSFEQSEVCRFLQERGRESGRRYELFEKLTPKGGVTFFDIVCLKTDSEELEYAENGRRTRSTGSKQMNLGMLHSMEDGLPFAYRTYPGSVADVKTLENMVRDLEAMGCTPVEIVMDRGFFSTGNIEMMLKRGIGFTVPIPARMNIEKVLVSESVGRIESPLNTDQIAGSTVRGYDTAVRLKDGDLIKARADEEGAIRAVVLQDDVRRMKQVRTLYSDIVELESKARSEEYDDHFVAKLSKSEKKTAGMLNFSKGEDGMMAIERKRKAITAKENACGRFVLLTTSDLGWKDLFIEYRDRNDIEYDFSQVQSDMYHGVKGRSSQDSVEGGLLMNFISLRLRLTLIRRLKESGAIDNVWVTDVFSTLKKLKISHIGDEWRLNEVTKAQRELLEALGVQNPEGYRLVTTGLHN